MIAIADAGSTKIDWCFFDEQGVVAEFETPGANALMFAADELRKAFVGIFGDLHPDVVYYYGAGCATPEICTKVADALCDAPRKEVASDMLGAARALLGRSAGIAAILGTGSNSAAYDGTRIVSSMPPMGYILGDEGSGAALGRRLLREVYRSGRLRHELEEALQMNYGQILDRVYRQPAANTFLASLTRFIAKNRTDLADVISEEFRAFFAALRGFYGEQLTSMSLTGGVAAAFEPELRAEAARANIVIDRIERRPINGLIKFHSHDQNTL